MATQAAEVNTGDGLTITSGVSSSTSSVTIFLSGSYFACGCNNNGIITDPEKNALHQGTEGIIIGVIQGTDTKWRAL